MCVDSCQEKKQNVGGCQSIPWTCACTCGRTHTHTHLCMYACVHVYVDLHIWMHRMDQNDRKCTVEWKGDARCVWHICVWCTALIHCVPNVICAIASVPTFLRCSALLQFWNWFTHVLDCFGWYQCIMNKYSQILIKIIWLCNVTSPEDPQHQFPFHWALGWSSS